MKTTRTLDDLPTPALILDRRRLLDNLATMRGRIESRGVALRPHAKTAKSPQVARLACGGREGPITVSTLREAEYFAAHGFRDITYAVGILPDRLPRAAALIVGGVTLQLVCDHLEVGREVVRQATQLGVRFRVLIEIDGGGARAGLPPADPRVLELAKLLHAAEHVDLAGVLTHAGQAYDCRSVEAIEAVARGERDAVVSAAARLLEHGLPCPVVSAGSTPTAVHAGDLSGVTEMRPGVYMFFDLAQLGLGSCRRDDLALSVLTSVIGHNREAGHVLVDAGALALSKDRSAAARREDIGYGQVCDPRTLERLPRLIVNSVHQEHGMIRLTDPLDFDRLPPGTRLRVLPNHACMTAAAYDRYFVLDGTTIVDAWERANGW